jgi:hypothetical protein
MSPPAYINQNFLIHMKPALSQNLPGYLHTSQDIVNNLLSRVLSTKVRSLDESLSQVGVNSTVNDSSGLTKSHKLQHDTDGTDSSNGVGNSTSLDVRSGTVARLTDGEVVTNVSGGNNTEGTNKSSGTIRQDVTVQVRSDNNIVRAGGQEHLVDHRVNNLLLVGNSTVTSLVRLVNRANTLTEKSISLGENIGLVGDGELRSSVVRLGSSLTKCLTSQSELKSNLSNVLGGGLGDTLDSLGDLGSVLEGTGGLLLNVKVLGVLADDDKVDGVSAGDGLDGTDVGVESETLTEGDNGGGVAGNLGGGGGNGSEESTVTLLLEDLNGLLGKSSSGGLEGSPSCLKVGEAELQSEGSGKCLEDLATGGNDLTSDTISGNESCAEEEGLAGFSERDWKRRTDAEVAGCCTGGHCVLVVWCREGSWRKKFSAATVRICWWGCSQDGNAGMIGHSRRVPDSRETISRGHLLSLTLSLDLFRL